eukprot:g70590.t1
MSRAEKSSPLEQGNSSPSASDFEHLLDINAPMQEDEYGCCCRFIISVVGSLPSQQACGSMPLAELPLDLLQEALAWALTAKDLHSLALINREHLRALDVVVRRRYAEAAGVLGAGCSLVLSKIRMLDEYQPTDSGSYEPLPLPPLWLLASRASDQEWEGITESNIFLENLDSVLKSECPELGPPGLPQRSCPAPRWAPFLSVRVDGRTANKKAVIVKLGFEHCSLADAKTVQAKTARPKGVVVLTAVRRLRDPVDGAARECAKSYIRSVCGHSAVMVLCAG